MLKTRVLTALILASALLSALFLLPPLGMLLIFVGIVVLAAWEWAGLLKMSPAARLGYGALTGLPCLFLLGADFPAFWMKGLCLIATFFWIFVVPLWFRGKWPLRNHAIAWLIGWVLLVPSWAAMVMLYQRSPWLLLAAMALVWVADIAAYFAGRAFGRHKLAPTISPGKTWEGAVGAVVGVLVYAALVGTSSGHLALLSGSQLVFVVLGLILLTVVSIFGDLFESLVKRQAGVKDSSALLPGHGGVLDRIDSLTSTLPFVALTASTFLAFSP